MGFRAPTLLFATLASLTFTLALPACGGDNSTQGTTGDGGAGDATDAARDGVARDSPADSSMDAAGDAGPDGLADALSDAPAEAPPPPDAGAFTLDPSFGVGGVATVNFGTLGAQALSIAVQANGSYVVGGSTVDTLVVARYLPTGALDTTFATGGIFQLPLGASVYGSTVLVQPDQRIDVVGTYTPLDSSTSNVVVFRLDASGNVDPSFGSSGYASTPGWAWTAVLQSDGSILVGGTGPGPSPSPTFLVARFLSTGTLDPAFGAGGLVIDTVNGDGAQAFALAVQSDGRILVGGADYASGMSYPLFLGRLTSSGSPDATFGTNGFVTAFPTTIAASDLTALAVQPDGKIVAGGYVGSGPSFGVGRYATDGTVDITFGSPSTPGWYVDTAMGGTANTVTVQADAKIAATGCAAALCGVIRLNADGTLDTTFANGGYAPSPVMNAGFWGLELADGSFAGVGATSGGSIVVAHLLSTGAPDPSFGTSGAVETAVGGSQDVAFAGAVQSDGKLVAVGTSNVASSALTRVTGAGALDPSFGKPLVSNPAETYGVALQSTGGIVAAGWWPSMNYAEVARFGANGSLDPAFGSGGLYQDFVIAGGALAVAANDDVLLAGAASSGLTGFGVLRLTPSGQLDPTFGSGGYATTPASSFGASTAAAAAVATPSNGNVVLAGPVDTRAGLARYSAAGVLDPTFGTGGVATIDLGGAASTYALVVQADARPVVAALIPQANRTSALALGRLTAAGVPDDSFGSRGVVSLQIGIVAPGRNGPSPIGLALAADGRILVCAPTSGDGITEHMLVLRFDGAGQVDARSVFVLSPGNDTPHALAVQPDGKLDVFGGTWSSATGDDFAFVRLIAPP